MSNSYKHTPIIGYGKGSEKQDKRLANRAFRRIVKIKVHTGAKTLPTLRMVSHTDAFSKDGKWYFGKEEIYKKYLRK